MTVSKEFKDNASEKNVNTPQKKTAVTAFVKVLSEHLERLYEESKRFHHATLRTFTLGVVALIVGLVVVAIDVSIYMSSHLSSQSTQVSESQLPDIHVFLKVVAGALMLPGTLAIAQWFFSKPARDGQHLRDMRLIRCTITEVNLLAYMVKHDLRSLDQFVSEVPKIVSQLRLSHFVISISGSSSPHPTPASTISDEHASSLLKAVQTFSGNGDA